MDEIANHAQLGMGTLYRHFPSKQALLTAMVGDRVRSMVDLARSAESIADPLEAFETMTRSYLEAAEGDVAFQMAVMGSKDIKWQSIEQEKRDLDMILDRIVERAARAGRLRRDFTVADFHQLTCGVISSMYLPRGGLSNWRRHLELAIHGVRPLVER